MAERTARTEAAGAPLWGVSAEFDHPDALVAALERLRVRDFGRLDAFSPVPIPGAADLVGLTGRPVLSFAAAGAWVGGIAMFAMCVYATMVSYRFNIGGRPLFSWPSYVVPSVSFGAAAGALTAWATMLLLSRLPRLNHPAFNIPNFTRATADGFFLAVEARDETFDAGEVEATLASLAQPPRRVRRVPR